MRSSLPAHSLQDDVPVYGNLASDISSSEPTYPTFATPIHPVGSSSEHALSGYGVSSQEEHHGSAMHPSRIDHNGLHLDPNLSPDGSAISRPMLPSSSPLQIHHEFSTPKVPRNAQQQQHPLPTDPPYVPNTAPPGQFDMAAPTPSTHPTWQSLHDYAQSHASAHGYALSINTTAKNRSRIKLACVCYGAPKNTHKLTPETRVRKNRVSYKTGCRMWVEGKKQNDGMWVLKVGEGEHNHPGRSVEGWAVQRKRTWGVKGGRVGMGGVTAKEEQEYRNLGDKIGKGSENRDEKDDQHQGGAEDMESKLSLERGGGLVWKIVEQEMTRKGGTSQGRDRGVGRTVKALEERLPGIHIFKRDVYNIRAQIKRARKATGQQIGEGLDNNSESDSEITEHAPELDTAYGNSEHIHQERLSKQVAANDTRTSFPQIDPSLIAQCNSALQNIPQTQTQHSPQSRPQPVAQRQQQEQQEVMRLRQEITELRVALEVKIKELEAKTSENESLRVQVELANMELYNRGGDAGQG